MKPELTTSFRVELLISNVLRWGVFVSLLLLGIGTALCFLLPGDYGCAGGTTADLHRLITTPASPFLFHAWLTSLAQLQGGALIVAGLILLITTPVLRVAVSVVAFALEKDRVYVVITSAVLLLLLLSFALGKAG